MPANVTLEPVLTPQQLDIFIAYATRVVRARDSRQDADAALEEFVLAAYANVFVVRHDWISDYDAHRQQFEDAAALRSMDMDTFRRTVIAHLRLDRFGEGHLRQLLETGYFAALVDRARELRKHLGDAP